MGYENRSVTLTFLGEMVDMAKSGVTQKVSKRHILNFTPPLTNWWPWTVTSVGDRFKGFKGRNHEQTMSGFLS